MLQEYLARTVEIRQRERTIEETDRHCPRQMPVPSPTPELIISMFFLERMKVTEIAKTIGVSHGYVSKVIKKYKKILIENLKK